MDAAKAIGVIHENPVRGRPLARGRSGYKNHATFTIADYPTAAGTAAGSRSTM